MQHSNDIENTLLLNGFPRKYARSQQLHNNPSPPTQYESFTSLPYIRGVSDKIQRILNQIGIKVAMKPYLTISKYLPSLKDPLKETEISGLVYQVPCHDCGSVYIGQTKRDLNSRIGEHKRAFKF